MGKYLQIQVRAWTYDEEEICRAWPRLTAAVWKDYDGWNAPGSKHGVMELAECLSDSVRFGDLDEEERAVMARHVTAISDTAAKLSEALGNWQPAEANRLSEVLETELSDLEKELPDADGKKSSGLFGRLSSLTRRREDHDRHNRRA